MHTCHHESARARCHEGRGTTYVYVPRPVPAEDRGKHLLCYAATGEPHPAPRTRRARSEEGRTGARAHGIDKGVRGVSTTGSLQGGRIDHSGRAGRSRRRLRLARLLPSAIPSRVESRRVESCLWDTVARRTKCAAADPCGSKREDRAHAYVTRERCECRCAAARPGVGCLHLHLH